MNRKPLGPLGTARYNLRRALDFERRRLTEAEWRELREWVREQVTDATCGRCKASIPAGDEEFCWHCHAPLCYVCWDGHGHCGHARADEINAAGMAMAEREDFRQWAHKYLDERAAERAERRQAGGRGLTA